MHQAFLHVARPYPGPTALAPTCAELVRAGLARGERPLMFARSACVEEVRDALGPLSAEVSFVPSEEHARNPARVVTMLHTFASAAGDDRRALGVLEPSARGRRPAELSELLLTECVLNSPVLAELAMSVVCLVEDDPQQLAMMRRCHPTVEGEGVNHDFDEALATELHASDLEPPPAQAGPLDVQAHGLADVRSRVRALAVGHGVAADRADDLVLAANEVVTNSLRHGGGRAAVRLWVQDGSVVCEVRDHGYLRDPMTGRLAPRPESTGGRGLWLVHHLCDLVQLRSSERSGTVVRMYVDR